MTADQILDVQGFHDFEAGGGLARVQSQECCGYG
jgi:hypothetical protein